VELNAAGLRLRAALVALLLAGCATTPTAPSGATPVPRDRLLAFQDGTQERTATQVVTRNSGIIGSACYLSFVVNGTHAARFAVGETARFHVAPGEILLRNGFDLMGRGLCSLQTDQWTQRETVIRGGETKHSQVRYSATQFGPPTAFGGVEPRRDPLQQQRPCLGWRAEHARAPQAPFLLDAALLLGVVAANDDQVPVIVDPDEEPHEHQKAKPTDHRFPFSTWSTCSGCGASSGALQEGDQ
jgi:hypothetical protein